jgi:D-serine deaminase-like pyridoxal phosphate-dependent protein
MNERYVLRDPAEVLSPGLVFFKNLIRRNIARTVEIARDPGRLRPHVKTHKTREIVRLAQEAGITKHKCATLAEAEMLAQCGVPDVLLAYQMVGPNVARIARLMRQYPGTRFAALADHPAAVQAVSEAMVAGGLGLDLLVDLDVGQHRTGIAPGPGARALYQLIARLPGVRPAGLHAYDGHNRQPTRAERTAAVRAQMEPVLALRAVLEKEGLPVPRVVAGGTPTFPIHAASEIHGLECAPGTCFLHDDGYGSQFPDLGGFTPAALVFTRVTSRPTPTRVTFDVGTKAIASDPPAGKRCRLLDVEDYEAVAHNEEHLVIETPAAERFSVGDTAWAVPTHICPTCALHRAAYVVEDGRVTGEWEIAARDRRLTV